MAAAGERLMRLCSTSAIAILAILALGATQALAATDVDLQPSPFGSTIEIDDLTNDDDAITISVAGGTITVVENGVGGATTADPECALGIDLKTVTCPLDPADPAPPAPPTAPVRFVDVQMNDGTDSLTNLNFAAEVDVNDNGETGNKTINSGPGNDDVDTGEGNDFVNTGAGHDSAETELGNDTINTGAGQDFAFAGFGSDSVEMGDGEDFVEEESFPNGADSLNGGAGLGDGVRYGFGFNGVTMTLNGLPDDGHPGEGDNLIGFEDLNGTEGADTLAGDGSNNEIGGGDGDDKITGGGGDDEIFPGRGNDEVEAGDGGDYVEGEGPTEEGADNLAGGPGSGDYVEYFGDSAVTMTLNGLPDDGRAGEGDNLSGFEGMEGGEGADTIVGDAANNLLVGGGGNDTMTGAAGTDLFSGGEGDDLLLALGGRDEVACGLGFDTPIHDADDIVNGDCERRGAEVASDSATVNKKGKAKVRVSCPAEEGAACKGKVALLSNGKQIGSGKFSVANGKTGKATVKLTKKGKKALAKSGNTLLVGAEARTTEPQGTSTNAEQLELEGKKKKKRGGKGGGKGR
jgi:hypothetical protein